MDVKVHYCTYKRDNPMKGFPHRRGIRVTLDKDAIISHFTVKGKLFIVILPTLHSMVQRYN